MATYRYIKWEITKKYGAGNGIIQVGELQLMSGGYDVAWNGSVVASNPGGDNPIGEIPQNAVDGTAAAKWLDANFSGGSNVGSSVLIIDNSVDITFDSYYYVTAFDSTLYSDRNPISWTLYGSSDGVNWTALHSVNDATIPYADETPTSVFNLVEPTPTPTVTPTITYTPTPSVTNTATPTPTPSHTPSPSSTPTPTPSSTVTPTPSHTPSPSSTPTPTPSSTVTPTPTPTQTPTVTPTPSQITYELSLNPVLQGDIAFGLGQEYITTSSDRFVPGQKIWLNATQKYYSFDYYEIHWPIIVTNSSVSYITAYGFTASFDPRTEVQLNTNGNIVGNNSLIIARYRV